MKTNFLNSIIAILIITIIIPGITPNIVSAVDEQVGGNGNSDNGNSSSENLSVGSSSDESSSTDIQVPTKRFQVPTKRAVKTQIPIN